jgi:hypothetical protein
MSVVQVLERFMKGTKGGLRGAKRRTMLNRVLIRRTERAMGWEERFKVKISHLGSAHAKKESVRWT